jgi:hypothetical protein
MDCRVKPGNDGSGVQLTSGIPVRTYPDVAQAGAQVAELVDALVSGTSG